MLHESPPETIAAVDLGSNSFHMIVARVRDGHLHIVDRMRETVRLAAGLDHHNRLSPEAIEKALGCLQRFGQRLRDLPPGVVLAVGTNTLRKARNADHFLARARLALGHPIETIAGREEARLIYLGVTHSLAGDRGRRLVIDIGGGSTELIVGQNFNPVHRESVHMGCVNMSRRFFGDGSITAEQWHRAEMWARLELTPVKGLFRNLEWQSTIGASGTIKAIERISQEMGWTEHDITPECLKRMRKILLDAGQMDKLKVLKGLTSDRAPVLPGGLVVLQTVFEALHVDVMAVSDGALREGLLYDLLGRIRHEDVRSKTIEALSLRYQVDRAHAERVRATALLLFNQCKASWRLGFEEQEFLSWAANLHEIGLAVSHTKYHKHGAYLIEHSDLAGFSRQEQQILAALVRGHRRKFPRKVFKSLQVPEPEKILKLAVLLRLAVLLHRSRSDRTLPNFNVEATEDDLMIHFPQGWLDKHPLSQADLEQEAAHIDKTKLQLRFQ